MTLTDDGLDERWKDTRTWLLVRQPFFGFLVLNMNLIRGGAEKNNIPTAAVARDGSLYLNREWVSKLSLSAFRGLIIHEVLHPAFNIFDRQGLRDAELFNLAHDYVINLIIDDMSKKDDGKITLPEGGALSQAFRDMSAEEVYDDLIKKRDENRRRDKNKPQCGGGATDGEGNGGDPLRGDMREDLSTTSTGKKADKGEEKARRALARDWQIQVSAALAAQAQAGSHRGDLPAGLQIMIDQLLNPAVDWRDYLANFIGERLGKADLSYRRPSRRQVGGDVLMPGSVRMTTPDVTVLWDTSGSMSGQEHRIFSELTEICESLHAAARMIAIDAAIHADVTLDDAQDALKSVIGGGGSDFRPAFELLTEECDTSIIIAFTDGEIAVPATPPPLTQHVLWVIVGGTRPPTDAWGAHIVINDKGQVVRNKKEGVH
jgi:predicted metal-dependent peptidase